MTLGLMLSWPFAIICAALMVSASYIYARRLVSRLNQKLTRVAAEFTSRRIVLDPSTFSVTDPRHIVVVTTTDIVVVDVVRAKLAQQFRQDDVRGLRIAEGGSSITFSFMLNGGAESRRIVTRSIAEFGPLFQLIAGQGKTIEFIPEKAA